MFFFWNTEKYIQHKKCSLLGRWHDSKKQIRVCLRDLLANHKEAEVPESNLIEEDYNRMTVNWIRQEIKSKHFTAPGIARMKKCPLVELLKTH